MSAVGGDLWEIGSPDSQALSLSESEPLSPPVKIILSRPVPV